MENLGVASLRERIVQESEKSWLFHHSESNDSG